MEKKRSRIPVLPFSGPGVADSSGWHENPTCLRESLLGFKEKNWLFRLVHRLMGRKPYFTCEQPKIAQSMFWSMDGLVCIGPFSLLILGQDQSCDFLKIFRPLLLKVSCFMKDILVP